MNPRVEQKFLEVLAAIKDDPKKLIAMEKPCFEDEDFDMGAIKKKADKPLFLKDQIRKHTLKKMDKKGSDSDDSDDDDQDSDDAEAQKTRRANKDSDLFTKMGVTQHEEEARIKREFK